MFKRGRGWLIGGIAAIVLLAVISSKYKATVVNAQETVLRDNLSELRRVIQQYIKDKQRAPQSLRDLVEAGYFRELPTDPITDSNSSWEPVVSTVVISPGGSVQGITDVHSGSGSISSNGTTYRTW